MVLGIVGQQYIGGYIRRSLDRQELSYPAQERLIRQRVADLGEKMPLKIYHDILSGKRPDRAGYQQMLADARSGLLKAVVFHKVNRFGRNAAEGLAAVEELRRLGVEIHVVDMPMLDVREPGGMFLFTVMLGQGQYQVEDLATEAKKGMVEKSLQGGWSWRAPDGYVNKSEVVDGGRRRAWVEVHPYRAAITRLAAMAYRRGDTTLRSLKVRLNELHERRVKLGKPGCLRRSGKPWTENALHTLLTNRFYIGEIEVPSWNIQAVGKHKPIIQRSTFDQVQENLRRQGVLKGQSHDYLLQGLVYLNDEPPIPMLSTMVRREDREYRYYYVYSGNRRIYHDAVVIEERAMTSIRNRLAELGSDPSETLRKRVKSGVANVTKAAQERLNQVLQERKNLLQHAIKAGFREAEIDAERQRLEVEENWARAELARVTLIEQSHEPLLAETAADIEAVGRWGELTIAAQRDVLQRMIQGVYVDGENVVRVVWQPLWDMLWFGPASRA